MPTQLKNLRDQTSIRLFTLGEEIAHSITHGIGVGLSIAGLTLLVVLAILYGNIYQVVSFTIYGATLTILYLASTLYHSFQHPRVKQVFQVIDHAAIYLLIAGTYTPFLLVSIRGMWGWTLLIIIWGLALLGVSFKILFINHFPRLSVLVYILMGWLCLVALKELLVNIPLGGLIWLAVGGIVYTVGVIFYALHKIPYTHVIWHIFVLGGSICHYFAVLLYLAPVSY
jgi:hemolysin III